MPTVAHHFKDLLQTLQQDPSSSLLDSQLKRLSQTLKTDPFLHCLALVSYQQSHQILLIDAAAKLLKHHQVRLYTRPRLKGDAFWLFAKACSDKATNQMVILTLAAEPTPDFLEQAA